MAEVYFYHLDAKPLQTILPDLLRRGAARGLRMVVETSNAANLDDLSAMIWADEDVSFIAHGYGEDDPINQPIWLCAGDANPNEASYRFYVQGALPGDISAYDRALLFFDGNSENALASARLEWKKRKSEGHTISYWKQDESGKWQNLA